MNSVAFLEGGGGGWGGWEAIKTELMRVMI